MFHWTLKGVVCFNLQANSEDEKDLCDFMSCAQCLFYSQNKIYEKRFDIIPQTFFSSMSFRIGFTKFSIVQ